MPSSVSRRRVVSGAAWAVPAVVIATAAPAAAVASYFCPLQVEFRVLNQRTSAYLSFDYNYADGELTLTVTSVTGPLGFGQIPPPTTFVGINGVQIRIDRSTDEPTSGPVTVTYTITKQGRVCTGYSVTFDYATPPPPPGATGG